MVMTMTAAVLTAVTAVARFDFVSKAVVAGLYMDDLQIKVGGTYELEVSTN
jgi:hypothetical protein